MVKYTCLGIACLTLVLSGVTRASLINIDYYRSYDCSGSYGKNDTSCDDKGLKLDDCKGTVGIDTLDNSIGNEGKNLEDCKDDKGCKTDKNDKDCKIDWSCDRHDHDHCYQDNQDGNNCDLVIDGCYHHDDGCEPSQSVCASVPAPASSAMGGAGLFGIALMTFIRARRSIVA